MREAIGRRPASSFRRFARARVSPLHVLHRIGDVTVRTVRFYAEDHCPTYAAAIAYYALFSLVPLSLIVLSVVGLAVDEARIVDFVFNQIPLEESPAVRRDVETIVGRAHDVGAAGLTAGLVILLWSSSGVFSAVRRGLTAATGGRDRHYWRGKLVDVAVIPVLGVILLTAVIATTVVQLIITGVARVDPLGVDTNIVTRLATAAISASASFVGFSMLYRFVPRPGPPWRETLSSAGLATFLFELVRNGYALVLRFTPFTGDTALYAGIGTALTFLLWTFLNASILLLGAEFGRAMRRTAADSERATAAFVHPFR